MQRHTAVLMLSSMRSSTRYLLKLSGLRSHGEHEPRLTNPRRKTEDKREKLEVLTSVHAWRAFLGAWGVSVRAPPAVYGWMALQRLL